jgi:nitrate/nitrite-specific signal transduction histidine kinase
VVTAVGAEFDDLPITVVADLAQDVALPRGLADDLAAALRSLLLNVRQHARAGRVVLHAAEDEDGTGWEVTLHDDGIGFDTSATTFGVGLREVVVEQLARSGVDVQINSIRDLGTTVTLAQTTAAEVP